MYIFLKAGTIIPIIGTLYFSYFIWRFIKIHIPIKWGKLALGSTIGIVGSISYFADSLFSLYTMVYLHALVISIILEIVHLYFKKYEKFSLFFKSGIITIFITGAIFGYGYYNMHNIKETSYVIESNKKTRLKILQISDLHTSNSLSINDLEKECQKFNEMEVDIIVLTGDIFDEKTSKKEMEEVCKILGSLHHTIGIYFIYGNHDANKYSRDPAYTMATLEQNLLDNGIQVLNDEIVTINNITLIGRGDANNHYYGEPRKEITQLVSDVDFNNYIIVLDHQPLNIEENANIGVDLQLSGHTHGGQLFPSGIIEEIITGALVYGRRDIGQFTAITSSGMAGWGYPIKTGAPSEYVVITIE